MEGSVVTVLCRVWMFNFDSQDMSVDIDRSIEREGDLWVYTVREMEDIKS